MDLGLKGKVVLVLASSKGLGKAIAAKFAQEGANVMLTSRSETELKAVAEDITKKTGSNVTYFPCELTNSSDIKLLVNKTVDIFGRVDILINNAGGPPAGKFNDFDDEHWQKAFELNLFSYIRAIREVIPFMRSQGGGRILNVASSSIKQPIEGLILSNTFRAGVIGLSKSLATELAPDKILINTLGPGRIATDRVAQLDQVIADKQSISVEEVIERTKSVIPLGRYGTPEEFATTAVFLCSDANTYVTGQALLVDGGMVKAL
ncbi:SDR family oxidoreductase [Bacillus solimangrovi]|uniref:3-oxoacyl-ACP reductase n=1 Tax=Bacillus solimangrovi TaxID=1305675 RepID=A0A1E5LC48_9BACI|nr:SDR family oxidoreductase [Bacillus solimangrovi]OEH91665.1 3-oxoacyl-ACP reductase [Bacillus solimangrovi]